MDERGAGTAQGKTAIPLQRVTNNVATVIVMVQHFECQENDFQPNMWKTLRKQRMLVLVPGQVEHHLTRALWVTFDFRLARKQRPHPFGRCGPLGRFDRCDLMDVWVSWE